MLLLLSLMELQGMQTQEEAEHRSNGGLRPQVAPFPQHLSATGCSGALCKRACCAGVFRVFLSTHAFVGGWVCKYTRRAVKRDAA